MVENTNRTSAMETIVLPADPNASPKARAVSASLTLPSAASSCCHTPETMTTRPDIVQMISVSTRISMRSEEHTSELQSRFELVCRLPLEKTNIQANTQPLNSAS